MGGTKKAFDQKLFIPSLTHLKTLSLNLKGEYKDPTQVFLTEKLSCSANFDSNFKGMPSQEIYRKGFSFFATA